MNQFLSIFFAVVLFAEAFLPNMDMCELIKLPNLLEHYQEVDDKTSALGFLASHYGDSQKSASHQQDTHDENLPFQGTSCCQGMVFFPEQSNFTYNSPKVIIRKGHSFYLAPVAAEYHTPIFQPPKSA